ncbi:DUF4865 family protein [Telmatospirillum siberiense]|uniref:DUF4865 domain-containing protein n=1 Tax=Telmatospirillum siberiense TaxID=382514 RepID=A0A2N3PXH3_9PROT|nr:DUF4865 family protein [Telmatospirillum siberiense]PKU25088.1 DUF4865 domain-containing protein [Telmatospirillum siberiense]
MIAMQYSFVLPADYDMAIIERRIRDKGHLLDRFPRLRFKAYLSARKRDDGFTSAENLYAPFYLWNEPEGLNAFLTSPGFAVLARDFGWPVVRTWVVSHAELGPELGEARFASREIVPIPPYSDLASFQRNAVTDAQTAVRAGALAAVAAFDPTAWTMVRFRLWRALPEGQEHRSQDHQTYRVGHVSLP